MSLPDPFRLVRHCLHAALFALVVAPAMAQGVQPYVDHWDKNKQVKKSEGLMVNGREWGEWKFWDAQGNLSEVAEFKSGQRDGHVVIYWSNGKVQHDGYLKAGKQDSLMQSFYRDGTLMEKGLYTDGTKAGEWLYNYADGTPMLIENCQDTVCLVVDAWEKDGTRTVTKGTGTLRSYYGSGTVHEESAYVGGVRSGPYVELHPAGNFKAKGSYLGGVKHGAWSYGYSTGETEKEET